MSGTTDGISVLHVDDEPTLSDVVATYLEREDDRIDVRTATSADDGLEILSEHDVDCIVSDYDMPRTNGIEFLEIVREDHPDLPFILYTGKGSEAVASDAISAGVTDYLQKESGTDHFSILVNRIVNAVERYRIESEAQQTRSQLEAISENSSDAIIIIDTDSHIQFANPAVEDLFGYGPTELRGEQVTKLMPERYREQHLRAVARYLETGETSMTWQNIEFPGLHRDGTEIPLLLSYSEFEQNGERRFIGILRDISERTRMEAELREREERFRQVAENIQEVVWISDPEKEEMLYVNPAYAEIWGQSTDRLYDTPTAFLEAIHPDDRDRVEAALDTQSSGGYDEEYRIVRPDGEVRWIRDYAVPVENDAGEVYRIVGVASDVTEQKEQKRQLETLIDNLPGIVYQARNEPDWPMELVRGECEEITGYAAEALERGEVIWGEDILHPEEKDRMWEAVQDALDNEEPFEVTYRIQSKDGTTKWMWERGRLIDSAYHDATILEGFITDITERKERERELQHTKHRLDLALQKARAGVWEWHVDTDELYWSDEMLDLLGIPEDEFDGSIDTFEDRLHPEDVDRTEAAMENAIEAGDPYQVEQRVETTDGEYVWLDVRGQVVENDDSLSMVGIAVDITDRKAQEARLQRQRDRLDKFASVVSHDLRNPLRVATTRLELLREESDSDHLGEIETALDRMDRIIEDVLWLARKGEGVGSMETVAIREVADDSWNIVADDTAQATLRYASDDLASTTILADSDRLRQLLDNLLRNSVEHGGEDVTVTVGSVEDGFYIEDDGPGIPPDERDDVFEAGYSTSEDGTGFGLNIVEQVVDAHGWDIEVTESATGGARFEITNVEFTSE
jgi:PAS domain S-box-containing protein